MSTNAYGSGTSSEGRSSAQPGAQEASRAAAHLLEITAAEADQWRVEAKGEAASIVADAREESAELLRAARAEAERVATAARDEAAQTMNDARTEAHRVREETSAVLERQQGEIARLERVADGHRTRLREHLTDLLSQVDPPTSDDDR